MPITFVLEQWGFAFTQFSLSLLAWSAEQRPSFHKATPGCIAMRQKAENAVSIYSMLLPSVLWTCIQTDCRSSKPTIVVVTRFTFFFRSLPAAPIWWQKMNRLLKLACLPFLTDVFTSRVPVLLPKRLVWVWGQNEWTRIHFSIFVCNVIILMTSDTEKGGLDLRALLLN